MPEASNIRLSIMDRPVVIRASDPALLKAAAEAYSNWRGSGQAHGPPITLALEAGEAVADDPLRIEVRGRSLRLAGAGVDGWADARSLASACRVPRALAGEAVDTLLLFLLTRSGRTPLHAAGVMC